MQAASAYLQKHQQRLALRAGRAANGSMSLITWQRPLKCCKPCMTTVVMTKAIKVR